MDSNKAKRILVVAGARPNFMKVAPLLEQLAPHRTAGRIDVLLVHTGQHYDESLSQIFFEQLGIAAPDVNLEVGSGPHGKQTAEILSRFEPVAIEWKPDLVIVVGDVNSTLACALVAAKLGIRVAHVEAGLRSFDRAMPEEINRLLTDAISDLLFASEPAGVENLRNEGISADKIHLTGNIMIDSLEKLLPQARKSRALKDLHLSNLDGPNGARRFALLTLHRPANVDSQARLKALLDVVGQIGRQLPVLFPAHPRTWQRLQEFGLARQIRTHWGAADTGVLACGPAGYLEFLQLMSAATLVLTDSGGIQEETTALGVPCLTLRDTTERPITVTEGTNTLVGSDPAKILSAAAQILDGNGRTGKRPALWDGHAAKRIVAVLLKELQAADPRFGSA